ncbi:MAG: ubiquitin-like domain-containing protein [Propionibacteriaceae bacterium]|nr:ubiquitin-like domain-containing protein [Propionibacteriaceae bacterium]
MSVVKALIGSAIGALVISLSGFSVNLAFGHEITLIEDGVSRDVSIAYASVAEILNEQNINLSTHDRVTPELSAVVAAETTVTVEYGRQIDLTLNGQKGSYWTFATTVGQVLSGLGLGESSIHVSVPKTTAVPREGLTLQIDTGFDVTVAADGATNTVHSYGTVEAALTDLGLTWDGDDIITPSLDTVLTDQLAISLVRVSQQTVTRDQPIPHETSTVEDPATTKGKVTVKVPGVDGVLTQTLLQTLHDGAVVAETVTGEAVTLAPVTEETTTGTKEPTTTASTGSTSAVPAGDAQQIAYDMLVARGWADEFGCLVDLWNRESGWRTTAANPSGAYGIPQALPGSKMAAFGDDWRTNPATQIKWGLSYIEGRYGTPCGAWSAFQSKGWY